MPKAGGTREASPANGHFRDSGSCGEPLGDISRAPDRIGPFGHLRFSSVSYCGFEAGATSIVFTYD